MRLGRGQGSVDSQTLLQSRPRRSEHLSQSMPYATNSSATPLTLRQSRTKCRSLRTEKRTISSQDFTRYSRGVEARPLSAYIQSKVDGIWARARPTIGLMRRMGWRSGTRASGVTAVSMLACLGLFPRIWAPPHRCGLHPTGHNWSRLDFPHPASITTTLPQVSQFWGGNNIADRKGTKLPSVWADAMRRCSRSLAESVLRLGRGMGWT